MALFSEKLIAQANDSINRTNRKYQKEIAIDFQGLFLNVPGTAVIIKTKDNRGRFVELTSSKNFRFQFGVAGNLPLHEKTAILDTSNIRYASKEAKTFNAQAMFGKERVRFYGRFNFYHGCDIGL